MQRRQWTATWTDQDGTPQEFTFVASDIYIIAEMDFQGSRANQGQPVPEFFTLKAGRQVERAVPERGTVEGRE